MALNNDVQCNQRQNMYGNIKASEDAHDGGGGSEHKQAGFSALGSATGSESGSARPTDETERGTESLARLNVSPEQLETAIASEIDKLFADLAAAAKANVNKAIIKPLSRRERRIARRDERGK